MTDIKSMLPDELAEYMASLGQPKYRANQIFRWLHTVGVGFDGMTDVSKSLRDTLRENCLIPDVSIAAKQVSAIDGTVKYLFRLYDGEYIESVFMRYHHGNTLCISTQAGCRMGCKFCASTLKGLKRNLLAAEMISQIQAAEKDTGERVSGVVLMGMGEPLDNFDNVKRFLELVSDPEGLGIGYRHISLSTSGVVPGIYKLGELNYPITLSISLHAPFDDIRSEMMKVNRRWNIAELLKACRDYQKITGRRISFEYAMIKGKNDTEECAKELARILKGILCHVNLIPVNPVKENTYEKTDRKELKQFADKLCSLGINTTVRRTLGGDIDASCGQLRRNSENKGGGNLENLQ